MRRTNAIVFLTASLTLVGCKVSKPNAFESKTIDFAKHHITVRNKAARNPLAYTPQNILDGKEAFGHYCVACHGMDGQKTGVPFAENMGPPLPSLASPQVQTYTDGQLKWVIDNGIWPSGMPASKGTLNDDEIWAIVLYLRHLPPEGAAGEPQMYNR